MHTSDTHVLNRSGDQSKSAHAAWAALSARPEPVQRSLGSGMHCWSTAVVHGLIDIPYTLYGPAFALHVAE